MGYKEKVYMWFKDNESHHRLELVCGLLNMCLPLELRFIRTCVQELEKRYDLIGELDSKANNASELSVLGKSLDERTRSKFVMYLALLEASNSTCSKILFDILFNTPQLVKSALTDCKSDRDRIKEMLLIYTMVLHHPVFTFDEKQIIGARLRSLQLLEQEIRSSKSWYNNKRLDLEVDTQNLSLESCHPVTRTQTYENCDNGLSVGTDPEMLSDHISTTVGNSISHSSGNSFIDNIYEDKKAHEEEGATFEVPCESISSLQCNLSEPSKIIPPCSSVDIKVPCREVCSSGSGESLDIYGDNLTVPTTYIYNSNMYEQQVYNSVPSMAMTNNIMDYAPAYIYEPNGQCHFFPYPALINGIPHPVTNDTQKLCPVGVSSGTSSGEEGAPSNATVASADFKSSSNGSHSSPMTSPQSLSPTRGFCPSSSTTTCSVPPTSPLRQVTPTTTTIVVSQSSPKPSVQHAITTTNSVKGCQMSSLSANENQSKPQTVHQSKTLQHSPKQKRVIKRSNVSSHFEAKDGNFKQIEPIPKSTKPINQANAPSNASKMNSVKSFISITTKNDPLVPVMNQKSSCEPQEQKTISTSLLVPNADPDILNLVVPVPQSTPGNASKLDPTIMANNSKLMDQEFPPLTKKVDSIEKTECGDLNGSQLLDKQEWQRPPHAPVSRPSSQNSSVSSSSIVVSAASKPLETKNNSISALTGSKIEYGTPKPAVNKSINGVSSNVDDTISLNSPSTEQIDQEVPSSSSVSEAKFYPVNPPKDVESLASEEAMSGSNENVDLEASMAKVSLSIGSSALSETTATTSLPTTSMSAMAPPPHPPYIPVPFLPPGFVPSYHSHPRPQYYMHPPGYAKARPHMFPPNFSKMNNKYYANSSGRSGSSTSSSGSSGHRRQKGAMMNGQLQFGKSSDSSSSSQYSSPPQTPSPDHTNDGGHRHSSGSSKTSKGAEGYSIEDYWNPHDNGNLYVPMPGMKDEVPYPFHNGGPYNVPPPNPVRQRYIPYPHTLGYITYPPSHHHPQFRYSLMPSSVVMGPRAPTPHGNDRSSRETTPSHVQNHLAHYPDNSGPAPLLMPASNTACPPVSPSNSIGHENGSVAVVPPVSANQFTGQSYTVFAMNPGSYVPPMPGYIPATAPLQNGHVLHHGPSLPPNFVPSLNSGDMSCPPPPYPVIPGPGYATSISPHFHPVYPGPVTSQSFKKPPLCSTCGKIGHSSIDCKESSAEESSEVR